MELGSSPRRFVPTWRFAYLSMSWKELSVTKARLFLSDLFFTVSHWLHMHMHACAVLATIWLTLWVLLTLRVAFWETRSLPISGAPYRDWSFFALAIFLSKKLPPPFNITQGHILSLSLMIKNAFKFTHSPIRCWYNAWHSLRENTIGYEGAAALAGWLERDSCLLVLE